MYQQTLQSFSQRNEYQSTRSIILYFQVGLKRLMMNSSEKKDSTKNNGTQ